MSIVPSEGGPVPRLLSNGLEFFPALLEAMTAARQQILLETYIFARDATGERVARALADAARRGVQVRVVVDGFGTRELPLEYQQWWDEAGVALQVFSPVPALLTLDRERLRRLHRKLACIDGEIGFVGGINVLDDFWDPNHGPLEHPRLDFAVQVEGRLAREVHDTMSRLWEQVSATGAIERHLGVTRRNAQTETAARRKSGVSPRLVLRDNLTHRRAIERAYLRAIGQARREVLIATAYFFPGRRFRRALREAAARGVRVRLLLQGRAEYLLPHRAAQSMYDSLLDRGIEIHEYTRSFLHAKVAVIDDWATVGSSNIDPFSLLLSREANVVVEDPVFAQRLREGLDHAIRHGAQQVLMDHVRRRPWWRRLSGWMAYGLLRLGVSVSGERLDQ